MNNNNKTSKGILFVITLLLVTTLVIKTLPNVKTTFNLLRENDNEEKEISILLPHGYRADDNSYMFLIRYAQRFENETGIKVTYERLMAGSYDRYVMKRNNRLYMKEGPTLILIPYHQNARELVEKGVALPIREKIENQKMLYNGLQDDYYLPVKIHGKTVSVNRVLLNNLNIEEPPLNWTLEDYEYLWDRWSNSQEVFLNRNIYYEIVNMKIRDLELIDQETGKVSLNNDAVKDKIQEIKNEVFSGKYIMNEGYTFGNYMSMLNNGSSPEGKESFDNFMRNSTNHFILNTKTHHSNGLSTPLSDRLIRYIRTSLLLPDVRENAFHMVGFVVNRNGKNIDLGQEFLNYLISEEVQWDIYQHEAMEEGSTNGIVNKGLEERVENFEKVKDILEESIMLRKYMASLLEEDQSHIFFGRDLNEEAVRRRFIRELTTIVFVDRPYSEEELSAILRKTENELTIYINE